MPANLLEDAAGSFEQAKQELITFFSNRYWNRMNQDQLDKVFNEFTQAEDDTTAKFGGTGGSITKQLVKSVITASVPFRGPKKHFRWKVPYPIKKIAIDRMMRLGILTPE